MARTYQVPGPDEQAYGPVLIEIIKQWIRAGRIAADTQVMRSDTDQRLAVVFHVLALYFIFKGFQACRVFNEIARDNP